MSHIRYNRCKNNSNPNHSFPNYNTIKCSWDVAIESHEILYHTIKNRKIIVRNSRLNNFLFDWQI